MPRKNGFVHISDLDALDRFITGANGSPVIILKHSNACGTSALAYQDMLSFGGEIGLVTVQQARDVSDEIERRTGVPHETPQVFILHDSEVLWTASHGRVRAAAVKAALEAVGSRQ